MKMAKYDDSEGVWRTIGGRRVFIRTGQSLSDAMIESGKFKNLRSDYRKAKEDDEYELYKKARENEDSIDPMTENSTDWEQLDKKYKERYEKENKSFEENQKELQSKYLEQRNKEAKFERETGKYTGERKQNVDGSYAYKEETFTSQSTNPFYDDTTYSKEQLDKMAENKIKPMKNTYSGRGWEGTNYDSNLSTKDIAKNISDYSKKEFPDVKLSRRTDYNSMDINIMSSKQDLYASASDIDKMSDKQVSDTIRDSVGGYTRMDNWLNENNRKTANGTFTAKDERDYLKEELSTYKSRKGDRVTGNEWYLSDYGKKVVSGLNREMNSYNFDDDDAMTDYFNSNFYGYVQIGKWDKPYEVVGTSMNDKIRDEAFRKYKKEHPNSKITLEQYLKKQ